MAAALHSLIKVHSHPELGSIFISMSQLRLASRGEATPISARIRICTQVCPTPKPKLCVRALGVTEGCNESHAGCRLSSSKPPELAW